jgi:flap endonuclease-1
VGPSTALNLIREHGNLEKVLEHMNNDPKKKFVVPESWPYQDARDLFITPDVRDADHPDCDFKWDAPDVDGLIAFLVTDKGFNEDRVRNGAARLTKNLKSAQQSRLEGFFKPMAKTDEEKASLKRKHDSKLAEQKKRKKDEAKAKKEAKAKPRAAG